MDTIIIIATLLGVGFATLTSGKVFVLDDVEEVDTTGYRTAAFIVIFLSSYITFAATIAVATHL